MKKITEKLSLKISIIFYVILFIDFVLALFVKNENLTVLLVLLLMPVCLVAITFTIIYIIKKVTNKKKTITKNVDSIIYLIITMFLGMFGAHKFIDKKIGLGILYLFTGGLFGIGWIIDIIKTIISLNDNKTNSSENYSSQSMNSTQNQFAPNVISQNNTYQYESSIPTTPIKENVEEYKNEQTTNIPQQKDSEDTNQTISSDSTQETSKSHKDTQFAKSFKLDGDLFELRYDYDEVKIVGTQYIDGAEKRLKELNSDSCIVVYREEDNPKDPKTVVICEMENGVDYKLGYLSKSSNLYDMFNDFKDRGEFVLIKVDEKFSGCFKLGFYKKVSNKKHRIKNKQSKIFTLTGTRNSDIQSAISYADVGDELSYDFDYEKDKYYVEASFDKIGYIPKSQEELIENADDIEMYIDDITENDNGIYSVKVEMYYNDTNE